MQTRNYLWVRWVLEKHHRTFVTKNSVCPEQIEIEERELNIPLILLVKLKIFRDREQAVIAGLCEQQGMC